MENRIYIRKMTQYRAIEMCIRDRGYSPNKTILGSEVSTIHEKAATVTKICAIIVLSLLSFVFSQQTIGANAI